MPLFPKDYIIANDQFLFHGKYRICKRIILSEPEVAKNNRRSIQTAHRGQLYQILREIEIKS